MGDSQSLSCGEKAIKRKGKRKARTRRIPKKYREEERDKSHRLDEYRERQVKVKGYALLLLFASGMSAKTIIALGFPRSTVYRWHANYRQAIKDLTKELKQRICDSPKEELKSKEAWVNQ